MKKQLKRGKVKLVGMLLMVSMLLSYLTLPISASTGGKTKEDAVVWAQNHASEKSSLDYDGAYGAQCVDLIKYYYVYLGNSAVLGNGKDYATNGLPNGWTRIKNYSGFVPQPGDVAVWTTGGGGAGHVAIVTSANASTMTIVEQNWVGKYCSNRSGVSVSGIWGVIRPDFQQGVTNDNLGELVPKDLGTNFTAVILNKNYWKPLENRYTESDKPPVRISDETGYANQLWYFERQSDGSYKISSCYDGKYLDVRDASTEVFTVIQTCENSGSDAQKWYIYEYGGGYAIRSKLCNQVMDLKNNDATSGNNVQLYPWNESAAQIWAIYRGEECVLKGPKLTVSVGDSKTNTRFTWGNAYGARDYVLKIWKGEAWSGNAYHETYANSGYEISLPAGTYQAYVDACHEYDYEMSNLVTFTVSEHKCNNTSKITNPTCTAQGYTTYTCIVCGNVSKGNYTNALGHNYSYKTTIVPKESATGKITGTCNRCSKIQEVTLPKLNTTDYTYKVLTAPTCTASGTGRYTWKTTSYGSYYFDEAIDKTGHGYSAEVTAPTCEKAGYITHTCGICGNSYVDGEVEALGHRIGEWITTKAATCEETGELRCDCERCDYFEIKEIKVTGHSYVNSVCTVCGDREINSSQEVCKVFVDVPHDAWYEGSVQYVYDEGIIVGDGNVFAPNDGTTRAMVAVILYRLADSPEVTDYTLYNKFKDLPKEHLWYSDAVAWALSEGVSTGDDANMLYNPNTSVTREQLALFLWRYAKYTGEDVTVNKTDAELFGGTYVNEWAKEGFAWAVDRELIKGSESIGANGQVQYDLLPQGGATRAQLATVLQRFLEARE